jgi:hypothetical protein
VTENVFGSRHYCICPLPGTVNSEEMPRLPGTVNSEELLKVIDTASSCDTVGPVWAYQGPAMCRIKFI